MDTIPPPIPQSAMPSVLAVTVTRRSPARAVTTCTDTVLPDEGTASAAAAAMASSSAPTSARTRSSTAGASDSRKEQSAHPNESPNVRTSECSV